MCTPIRSTWATPPTLRRAASAERPRVPTLGFRRSQPYPLNNANTPPAPAPSRPSPFLPAATGRVCNDFPHLEAIADPVLPFTFSVKGGEGDATYVLNLGAYIGEVRFSCAGFDIEYDDNEGLGPLEVIWSDLTHADAFAVSWDGNDVINTGPVTEWEGFVFNKTSAYPTTVTVTVSANISGYWSFLLDAF